MKSSSRRKAAAAEAGQRGHAAGYRRVIKKYPNRRLYDTATSSYVTLEMVRGLVLEREPFVVLDARDGSDLTRGVLLQILLEGEADGEPVFSERALADIIRFYNCATRGFMAPYLERHLHAMMEMQTNLASQSRELTPELWSRLMRLQSLVFESAMVNPFEHSQAAFFRMQEQLAREALEAFGLR